MQPPDNHVRIAPSKLLASAGGPQLTMPVKYLCLAFIVQTPNMAHPLDGEAAALFASDVEKYEAAAAAAAAKAPKA